MRVAKLWKARGLGVALAVAGFAAAPAKGNTLYVTDLNSTMGASESGLVSWTVDGFSQVVANPYWYRIGVSGPEHALSSLPATVTNPEADEIDVNYTGPGFTAKVVYHLQGNDLGSYTADISTQASIKNTSNSQLDLHLFEYSNFSVGGTTAGNHVDLNQYNASQTSSAADINWLLSASDTPPALRYEAQSIGITSPTLVKLSDALPSSLAFTASPSATISAADGNVTWAFEWNTVIAKSKTWSFSEDKNISGASNQPLVSVPLPPALWAGLSMLGALGMGKLIRRRSQA